MINPASETFGQARQGSVAAIIQVLNERLADIGIRTRAVVAEGMLQLLCEAEKPEQLDKTIVVDRVRSELETISPQRIKRVKINSRIVKEEQLLWLEEINRDPENALLWAEIITLKRPFFIKRWFRDRNLKPAGPIFRDITAPEPKSTPLATKLIGAGSLAALVAGVVWAFQDDLRPGQPVADLPDSTELPAQATSQATGSAPASSESTDTSTQGTADTNTGKKVEGDRTADTTPKTPPSSASNIAQNNSSQPTTSETEPSATTEQPTTATPAQQTASAQQQTNSSTPATNSGAVADAFAEAVRVASQAANDGQTASTAAEWLDLAARWQRASDLMAEIPEGSEQYAIAQDRVTAYKTNSTDALAKAAAQQ